MRPISFIVRDGGLFPETETDVDTFNENYGDGEVIETELRPPQDPGVRRFWVMVTPAWKAIGKMRWDKSDDMGDAIKIALKHCHLGESLKGSPYFISDSLTKIKDWPAFLARVKQTLIDMGVDEELLRAPNEAPPHTEIPDGPGADTSAAPSPSGAVPYSKQECFEKFLLIAQQQKSYPNQQQHLKAVDWIETQWNEALPKDPGFVRKCANNARMVIAGSQKLADMRKLLEGETA